MEKARAPVTPYIWRMFVRTWTDSRHPASCKYQQHMGIWHLCVSFEISDDSLIQWDTKGYTSIFKTEKLGCSELILALIPWLSSTGRKSTGRRGLPTSWTGHQDSGLMNHPALWNVWLCCQRNNPPQAHVRNCLKTYQSEKRRMSEFDPGEAGMPLAKPRTQVNSPNAGQQIGAGLGEQPASSS